MSALPTYLAGNSEGQSEFVVSTRHIIANATRPIEDKYECMLVLPTTSLPL